MGGHYGSVQIRTTDRAAVKAAVEAVATTRKFRCLIGPELNGWVGVYPEGHGQDESVGREIAGLVDADVLQAIVHDDDVMAYWLWQRHLLVDSYWSSPGVLGEENLADEESRVGNPEMLRQMFGAPVQKIAAVLDRNDSPTFEYERLAKFAKLLAIENAVCSYEYLLEGEVRVKQRRQFIEIPVDNQAAIEKAERAAAAKKVRDERKRLKSSGVLLVSLNDGAFRQQAAAVNFGFIRSPKWLDYEQVFSLQYFTSPWKDFELVGFDLPPRSNPFHFIVDPTGRWVVGMAADDAVRLWEWDGSQARHVKDLVCDEKSGLLAISTDGTMIARTLKSSDNTSRSVSLIDVASGKSTVLFEAKDLAAAGMSPDWKTLVVAAGDTLQWIPLSKDQQAKTFSLEREIPKTADEIAAEKAISARLRGLDIQAIVAKKRQEAEKQYAMLDKMKVGGKQLSAQEIERTRNVMETHLAQMQKQLMQLQTPKAPASSKKEREHIHCVGFSDDGKWFWIGSNFGLSVCESANLADGITEQLNFKWKAKTTVATDTTYAHVHTVTQVPNEDRILFAGHGAHVMEMDLSSGAVTSLTEIPEATNVLKLSLSPDGNYLCVLSNNNPVRGSKLTSWFQIWDYLRLKQSLVH